jgi:prophage regulatory protein
MPMKENLPSIPNFQEYERFLRAKEVIKMTGLSRSYLYSLAAEGLFPQSVPLVPGGKARAWVLSEVQDWLNQRISDRDEEVQR